MFEIKDNTIIYERYPKHWESWRKLFVEQAEKVARDYHLTVQHTKVTPHQQIATYFFKGKAKSFSSKEIEAIRGKYFGDFH